MGGAGAAAGALGFAGMSTGWAAAASCSTTGAAGCSTTGADCSTTGDGCVATGAGCATTGAGTSSAAAAFETATGSIAGTVGRACASVSSGWLSGGAAGGDGATAVSLESLAVGGGSDAFAMVCCGSGATGAANGALTVVGLTSRGVTGAGCSVAAGAAGCTTAAAAAWSCSSVSARWLAGGAATVSTVGADGAISLGGWSPADASATRSAAGAGAGGDTSTAVRTGGVSVASAAVLRSGGVKNPPRYAPAPTATTTDAAAASAMFRAVEDFAGGVLSAAGAVAGRGCDRCAGGMYGTKSGSRAPLQDVVGALVAAPCKLAESDAVEGPGPEDSSVFPAAGSALRGGSERGGAVTMVSSRVMSAISAMLAGRSSGSGCSIASMSGRNSAIDAGQVGHAPALLDDLELRAAHVERLAAQRRRQHQPETVDVGLLGHLAAEQPELLRARRSCICRRSRPPISVSPPIVAERAMPKSMIFARSTLPPGRMMLSGERSRWMVPASCAALKPGGDAVAEPAHVSRSTSGRDASHRTATGRRRIPSRDTAGRCRDRSVKTW